MQVRMKVELEKSTGETEKYTVVADARDIRAYEAEFKQSWISTELSFIQLAQLAWIASRRQRKFTGSYDVFDAEAVDVSAADAEETEKEGEVEPAAPTRRGRTAKPS